MGRNLDLLQKVSLFSDLSNDEMQRIERLVRTRSCGEGAIIVNQDDKGSSLFVICKGKVKISLLGRSGREITINWYGPGEIFGEMSLLSGEPRSASVIAMEETELLVLDREPFVGYLLQHPQAAIKILAILSRRLRHATDIIGNLALLDVYGRVAQTLKELTIKNGEETADGLRLKQRPRQHEIASLVGTTRETVSRVMNELERRGLIVMEGRSLLLRRNFLESF